MKCPFCGHGEDKVVDSRESDENDYIRRRRECLKCERRYTTYERIESIPLMVVKKDGRRQPFDRKKILLGLTKACEKRPISMEQLEELTDTIERTLQNKFEKEVMSREIGTEVMKRLHAMDDVAYVRFASVYHQFRDLNEFMDEVKDLITNRKNNKQGATKKEDR
ncbi:MAG: transcriptional repressor NrdR [Candidatus Omnitrophica bacterium]|nr:transcriptional repressor NrdR [Candidatus Omnitrophota bacterium]